MDVDQAAAITVDEVRGQYTHESRQYHEVGFGSVYGLRQCGIEVRALRVVAMIDDCGWHAVVRRGVQTFGCRVVADDRADLRRQPCGEQGFHVAAAPGNQYYDAF